MKSYTVNNFLDVRTSRPITQSTTSTQSNRNHPKHRSFLFLCGVLPFFKGQHALANPSLRDYSAGRRDLKEGINVPLPSNDNCHITNPS